MTYLVWLSPRVLCKYKQSSSSHYLRVLRLLIRHQILLSMHNRLHFLGLVLRPDHFDVLLQPKLKFKIVLIAISGGQHAMVTLWTHLGFFQCSFVLATPLKCLFGFPSPQALDYPLTLGEHLEIHEILNSPFSSELLRTF